MANVVEIVLNGRADGLNSAFRSAQNAVSALVDGIKSGNAAVAIFNAAFELTSDVLVQSITSFVDYSNEVEKLSRLTGMNVEDTSRMIQVADDLRISYGELQTAMRFAAKNGIEPNIENIARLSDEYLKLNPGQERAAFLMENFGRSGLTMGKLMEQGSVKLMQMNGAIDENLVLTDDAIRKANDYQKAVDDLNDSWEAVKMNIGQQVIPTLTNMLKSVERGSTMTMQQSHSLALLNDAYNDGRISLEKYQAGLEKLGLSSEDVTETTQEQSDAVKELEIDYKDLLSLTESIADETKNYEDTIAELKDKQAELTDEMAKTTDPQEIKNLQDEYDAYGDKIEEVTTKHEAATQRMLYDLLVQKLAVEGLTDAEFDIATGYAEAAGVIDKKSATSARAINNVANKLVGTKLSSEQMATAMKIAFDKGEKAAMEYIDSLNKIPTKVTTFTVASTGVGGSGQVSTGGGTKTPVPKAQGDYVQAGEVYKVGEVGPELFVPSSNGRIVPNDQMGKSGVTNNYMYGTFIVQGSGGALDITGVR